MSATLEINSKFGKLKVLNIEENRKGGCVIVKCLCDCGNESYVYKSNLISGKSKSCGNCGKNTFKIEPDGKTVVGVCVNGETFKFDIADFEKVKRFKWYANGEGSNKSCCNSKGIYLHRYLLDFPEGYEIDHIDRDRMNNCRSNLRICTHQQNQCNQYLQCNNTSGVIGVRFYRPRNKFVARIKYWGKDIHLGYYINKPEAMQARNEGAKLLFGEFAILTDVSETPLSIKKFVYDKCSPYLKQELQVANL